MYSEQLYCVPYYHGSKFFRLPIVTICCDGSDNNKNKNKHLYCVLCTLCDSARNYYYIICQSNLSIHRRMYMQPHLIILEPTGDLSMGGGYRNATQGGQGASPVIPGGSGGPPLRYFPFFTYENHRKSKFF